MRHHDQTCDRACHWTSVACVSTRSGLFRGMDSLFTQCIIELNVASVTVSSRVIQLSVVRASAVVRVSPDC